MPTTEERLRISRLSRSRVFVLEILRNVASLPYLGDRKIHGSKPCVEATDPIAAPVAGAGLRMAPFGGSSLAGNLYFHELVHHPLEHFQQGIFSCYKIQ